MLFKSAIQSIPFKTWIWKNQENKNLLTIAFAALIIQFVIFKFFYPRPNFMPPDSYSYLTAAYKNLDISIWTIGYSKFLRLFSSFTSSDVALVWFQYIVLQSSILYFLFTIKYFMQLNIWLFSALLAVAVLNPLVPHISNFVGSDCIFTSLSLIWYVQLIWIMYDPTLQLYLWHSVVLLCAFTVRYNALYYPIISVAIIILSTTRSATKIISLGAISILLGLYIARTEYAYKKETGVYQFSAFEGWQIAANALYGYAYARIDSPLNVPKQFRKLQVIANTHIEILSHYPPFLRPDHNVGVYYLWDFYSPLKTYERALYGKDTESNYFHRWATLAPLYKDYGRFLILHHPMSFLKHYLWPNLIKYYVPPPGFMDTYILKNDHVDTIAAVWFNWKSTKIQPYFKDKRIQIVKVFPIVLAIINLSFILTVLAFRSLSGFQRCAPINKNILLLTTYIWFFNMVFSVFAAPIELRYQLFPMILTTTFLGILISFLVKESVSPGTMPNG